MAWCGIDWTSWAKQPLLISYAVTPCRLGQRCQAAIRIWWPFASGGIATGC